MTRDPYTVVLKRRPPDAPPPQFICAICGDTRQPQTWPWRALAEHPPICHACQRRWGAGFGGNVQGCTRGERHHMERLAALINAIKRKTMNGPATL